MFLAYRSIGNPTRITVIICLLFIIGCGDDSEEAVITGVVSDSQTNTPLAGVIVYVGESTSTTGNDGKYTIENVTTGQVTLEGEREGYTPFNSTVDARQGTNHYDITMVKLTQTYILSGNITGPNGLPASDVSVQTMRQGEELEGEENTEVDVKTDTTDRDGNYQISHLPPGEYILTVAKEELKQYSATVLVGNRDKEFNIAMEWDNVLEGNITEDRILRAEVSPYIVSSVHVIDGVCSAR